MQSVVKKGQNYFARFVFQGREVYEEKFCFKSEAGDKDGIEIPQKVEIIINILEKAGYEAYAVGG